MAVCSRLISDNLSEVDHQCSLCLFLTGKTNHCPHTTSTSRTATATPFSECSFYTCQSATSTHSTTSISSGSSSSTLRARRSNSSSTSTLQQHSLRRRQSPTELSLRDLNRKQARQLALRQRRSEEELQQVYERQILQYLNSGIDCSAESDGLGTIPE